MKEWKKYYKDFLKEGYSKKKAYQLAKSQIFIDKKIK